MTGIALAQTAPYQSSFRHFSSPSVSAEEMLGDFKAMRHFSLGYLSISIFPGVHPCGPYGGHRVGLLDACSLLLITLHYSLFSSEDPFREEGSQVCVWGGE